MTNEEFLRLADEVARELGERRHETWTRDPGYPEDWNGANLLGPGHASLHLNDWTRGSGRLAITGRYPEGSGRLVFEITVAVSRGAKVIAAEADRRVISAGYADELLLALDRKRAADARIARRQDHLSRAARLFGAAEPDVAAGEKLYLGDYVAGQGKVEGYWGPDDMLNIDISGIPAEVAITMLAVLAGSVPGTPAAQGNVRRERSTS